MSFDAPPPPPPPPDTTPPPERTESTSTETKAPAGDALDRGRPPDDAQDRIEAYFNTPQQASDASASDVAADVPPGAVSKESATGSVDTEPSRPADQSREVVDNPGLKESDGSSFQYEDFSDRDGSLDLRGADTVRQGEISDCYLIAAANSIADRSPELLESAVRDEGDHATVRLYDDGVPTDITVDKQLPTNGDHEPSFATPGGDSESIGPGLLEKAFAANRGNGEYFNDPDDGRSALTGGNHGIEGGYPADALEILSGVPAERGWPEDMTPQEITDVCGGDSPAVASSYPVLGPNHPAFDAATEAERQDLRDQYGVVDEHAYSVVGVSDDGVVLSNPWGLDHPDPVPVGDFQKLFVGLTWLREDSSR
jgi:hypothetical protein